MDARSAGEFDEVSTSAYSVLAYLLIGSTGLWMFFRAHSVPLSYPEVSHLADRVACEQMRSCIHVYRV